MLAKNNQPKILNSFILLLSKLHHFLSKQLFNVDNFMTYIEPIVQQLRPSWRYNRIPATVKTIKHDNTNIFSISLEPSKKWHDFEAGQHIQLTVEKDGALYTRTFSMASSPKHYLNSGELVLTIREIDNGTITPWLRRGLKVGSTVYISQAKGNFTIKENEHQKIFIAGGSGITPIHSMLSNSMDKEWLKQAHLIFYTRDQNNSFYHSQLNRLEQAGLNIHCFFTEQGTPYEINQILNVVENTQLSDFYLCGPSGLIQMIHQDLLANEIGKHSIHQEHFTASTRQTLNLDDLNIDEDFIQVDYLDSKKQSQYEPSKFIGEQAATLLDMAEEEGLSPVSGCRIGVCHQCICKKKNGRVLNTKTGEYSDSGEEEIQLCISVPTGPVELEL